MTDHVFIWLHHAPVPVGSHGDNSIGESQAGADLNRPEYKVTAVFAGHDHLYARMDDSTVAYIVSGGRGPTSTRPGSSKAKSHSKMVYNFVAIHLAGCTMSAVAYDDTGTEIDRLPSPRPAPPDGGIYRWRRRNHRWRRHRWQHSRRREPARQQRPLTRRRCDIRSAARRRRQVAAVAPGSQWQGPGPREWARSVCGFQAACRRYALSRC